MLLKTLAYLVFGVGIAVFLFSLFKVITAGSLSHIGISLIMLFYFALATLLMMIFAELIHVFLAIEENTRRTADKVTGERAGTTPRIAD